MQFSLFSAGKFTIGGEMGGCWMGGGSGALSDFIAGGK